VRYTRYVSVAVRERGFHDALWHRPVYRDVWDMHLLEEGYMLVRTAVTGAIQEIELEVNPRTVEEWQQALQPRNALISRMVRSAADNVVERISDQVIATALRGIPGRSSTASALQRFLRARMESFLRRALDTLISPEQVQLHSRTRPVSAEQLGRIAADAVEEEWDGLIHEAFQDDALRADIMRHASGAARG
jgi:hypothetical protein